MILINLLSSIRFAVTIFVLTAIASGISTFLGWEEFFSSPYFLTPAVLFALSLVTCTGRSIIERPKRRITAYAPETIHVGVLVLMLGGLLTLLAAREEVVVLGVGESMTVREEWQVTLLDSERTGMNWVSTLQIEKSEEIVRQERLAVNEPVRVGPVRLLQQSWEDPRVLILEGPEGNRYTMAPGEGFASGETVIILEESEGTDLGLRFARFVESMREGTIAVEEGMTLAELTVVGSEERILSGIQVVHDPGAPFALAGAIILILGFGLYIARRVREDLYTNDTT